MGTLSARHASLGRRAQRSACTVDHCDDDEAAGAPAAPLPSPSPAGLCVASVRSISVFRRLPFSEYSFSSRVFRMYASRPEASKEGLGPSAGMRVSALLRRTGSLGHVHAWQRETGVVPSRASASASASPRPGGHAPPALSMQRRACVVTLRSTIFPRISLYNFLFCAFGSHRLRVLQARAIKLRAFLGERHTDPQGNTAWVSTLLPECGCVRRNGCSARLLPPSSLTLFPDRIVLPAYSPCLALLHRYIRCDRDMA